MLRKILYFLDHWGDVNFGGSVDETQLMSLLEFHLEFGGAGSAVLIENKPK